MCKWFTDKESSTTTNVGRTISVARVSRKTEETVVGRSAVHEFSRGIGRFDPSFSEAEEIGMVSVYYARDSCRMKWVG